MQVIRINTWLSPGEAMKIIELLDALRESLVEEHYEGIRVIMQVHPNQSASISIDKRQLELPIGDDNLPFNDDIPF